MKYEARTDETTNCAGHYCPVSKPTSVPVNSNLFTINDYCLSLGRGYAALTDQEWMTMADNIASLPINDLDSDANLQLATGYSDQEALYDGQATTYDSEPIISGCNLMKNMEDTSNNYVAGSCEIRGDGSTKGYYGTGDSWSTTGYSPNGSNKSQLRTQILSNGNVIWDIAGNIAEITNNTLYDTNNSFEMPIPSDWVSSSSGWYDYATTSDSLSYSYIVNYKGLGYIKPVNPLANSNNGIGMIYLDQNCGLGELNLWTWDDACNKFNYHNNYRQFIRGGGSGPAAATFERTGIYNLFLAFSPTVFIGVGFRCTYR